MKNSNNKDYTQVIHELSQLAPNYLPTDKAYYLDTRAKRIVNLEVIESLTSHLAVSKPEEEDTLLISFQYRCKTSIGELTVPENQMIRTFKEASYQLGLLLND